MAMSDTGSSFPHWAALFDHTEPELASEIADGNLIAAAASPTSAGSGGSPTTTTTNNNNKAGARHHQLGIEGPRAAGKPARRRSRASRRAPVTLLNTDTSNFRAMVQQFTGIPAPPAGAFGGVPVINFAGGDYGGFAPHAGGVMSMSSSFDHRSHQHLTAAAPLHDQLRIRQQQHPHHQFGYSNGLLHGAAGGDIFASTEDRMLLQSIQAAQMPTATAVNNTSLGFFA